MKNFKEPKVHHFDFTGLLTKYDNLRVNNYIREIDREIEAYERELARLKKQRSEARTYRLYYTTGIPRTRYNS